MPASPRKRHRAPKARQFVEVGRGHRSHRFRAAGDEPAQPLHVGEEFPPDPILLSLWKPGDLGQSALKCLRHAAILTRATHGVNRSTCLPGIRRASGPQRLQRGRNRRSCSDSGPQTSARLFGGMLPARAGDHHVDVEFTPGALVQGAKALVDLAAQPTRSFSRHARRSCPSRSCSASGRWAAAANACSSACSCRHPNTLRLAIEPLTPPRAARAGRAARASAPAPRARSRQGPPSRPEARARRR